MATQPELFQFTDQAINQVIPQGPALALRPPPTATPASVPAIPSDVSLRPGGVGVPATSVATAPAPAVSEVGASPFRESRSPLGINISPPTETPPLPAPTAEGRVGKAFGIGPNKLGIPEDLDIATLLGSLAQAVGPETIGGRVGGAVAGFREAEKAREIKRIGVESQAEARRGATAVAERRAGVAETKEVRDQEEFDRQSNLRDSFSAFSAAPPGPEKDALLQDIQGFASTKELNDLANIGIVPKPTSGTTVVELPGIPGEFGVFNLRSKQFERGPGGTILRAPTPGQLVPRFTPVATGTGEVATIQSGGVGAGPTTIKTTGIPSPAEKKSDFTRKMGIAEKIIKERKQATGDTTPIGVEDIVSEFRKQFPKGGKASLFSPPGADAGGTAVVPPSTTAPKTGDDMVRVLNKSTRSVGFIPRGRLADAVKSGRFEEAPE